jgi:hypothetical protein
MRLQFSCIMHCRMQELAGEAEARCRAYSANPDQAQAQARYRSDGGQIAITRWQPARSWS